MTVSELPTEMTVGGRTYEILHFQSDKEWADAKAMAAWASKVGASVGQEEGEHLLKYQDQIPTVLRGNKVTFVFTDWRESNDPSNQIAYWRVGYVGWLDNHWIKCVRSLQGEWDSQRRLLRRKA